MAVATFTDQELFNALEAEWLRFEKDEIQKAKNNDGKTLYEIGQTYYRDHNYSQALAWYLKASAQKQSEAQYMVGYMCQHGEGVAIDFKLAINWYLKAVSNGQNIQAQYNLGFLYRFGYGTAKNVNTAIEWLTKAAKQGHSQAQYDLGYIYDNYNEVKDLQKSVNWYKKADNNGHKDAKKCLERFNKKGYYPEDEADEKNEEQITNAVNSITLGEEIKGEVSNNCRQQTQANSSNRNVEHDIELLKEKVKNLEEIFQLKFSLIEQKHKVDVEKMKALEYEKQKAEVQQKEKDEEIKQLKDDLSKYKAALKDNQEKLEEKDEEIRSLKTSVAEKPRFRYPNIDTNNFM